MYSLAELKAGMTIRLDGQPYLILSASHSKQARGMGVGKTSLKNLLTGTILQRAFQGNDKIEPAEVAYSKAQYLYKQGDEYHFMDGTTFEQFHFFDQDLGEKLHFLVEGQEVDIQNFEDRPINVILPPKVNLKVMETEPGVKGDTASGGSKPATVETGYVLQVPLFINVGDTIRINTETGEYVERA